MSEILRTAVDDNALKSARAAIAERVRMYDMDGGAAEESFIRAYTRRAVRALRTYGKKAVMSAPYTGIDPKKAWRVSAVRDAPGVIRVSSSRMNAAAAQGYTMPPERVAFTPTQLADRGDDIRPVPVVTPGGRTVIRYTSGYQPHARSIGRAPFSRSDMPAPEGFFVIRSGTGTRQAMTAYPTTSGGLVARPALAEESPGQWVIARDDFASVLSGTLEAAADGAFLEIFGKKR